MRSLCVSLLCICRSDIGPENLCRKKKCSDGGVFSSAACTGNFDGEKTSEQTKRIGEIRWTAMASEKKSVLRLFSRPGALLWAPKSRLQKKGSDTDFHICASWYPRESPIEKKKKSCGKMEHRPKKRKDLDSLNACGRVCMSQCRCALSCGRRYRPWPRRSWPRHGRGGPAPSPRPCGPFWRH